MTVRKFTREEILAGVREDIAECVAVDLEEVTLEANFKYDLGGDSIDYMDLFFRTQKRFEIRSPWPKFVEASVGPANELPARLTAIFPRINWKQRLGTMSTNDLEELFTTDLIVELLFNAQFEDVTGVSAGATVVPVP